MEPIKLKNMNETEYKELFNRKTEKALERAWLNRDFEIELYWKRASYFWTFIAAAFVGYITLITSSGFNENLKKSFPQIEYIVICLGLIFSVAWVLVNVGSKRWQKNWENHIDVLEDEITGPIYKVINKTHSYSVTKINFLISLFVSTIWLILGIRYSINNLSLKCLNCQLDWLWIFITILTVMVIGVLIFGYGKTKSTSKTIEFIKRNYLIKDEQSRTTNSG